MIPEPEMIVMPEMIVVPETISVPRKVLSLMSCEVMAGKTMPGEPSEMVAATSQMASATGEMVAATSARANRLTDPTIETRGY